MTIGTLATRRTLSNEIIAAATIEPGKTFRKLAHAPGLYVKVTADGRRRWYIRVKGSDHWLGDWPGCTIADAEAKAEALRKPVPATVVPVQATVVPVQATVLASAGPSFGTVAAHWLTFADGKAQSKATLYKRKLYAGYLGALDPLPIADITPAQVREILEGIVTANGVASAHRAATYASNIFDHAQRYDVFHNPAARRKAWLPAVNEMHHEAIVDPNVFGFMMEQVDLWESGFGPTTSNALRFCFRTVVRASELAGATWVEMRDLDRPDLARWEIPAERMKGGKRAHIVPLSPQAVAILQAQRAARPQASCCFAHRDYDGRPMESDNLLRALEFIGYKGKQSAHGIRTCFSTLAREAGQEDAVIGLCLAHADRNKVRAAYNRAERMAERRALMCWWGDEIERLKQGYKVPT